MSLKVKFLIIYFIFLATSVLAQSKAQVKYYSNFKKSVEKGDLQIYFVFENLVSSSILEELNNIYLVKLTGADPKKIELKSSCDGCSEYYNYFNGLEADAVFNYVKPTNSCYCNDLTMYTKVDDLNDAIEAFLRKRESDKSLKNVRRVALFIAQKREVEDVVVETGWTTIIPSNVQYITDTLFDCYGNRTFLYKEVKQDCELLNSFDFIFQGISDSWGESDASVNGKNAIYAYPTKKDDNSIELLVPETCASKIDLKFTSVENAYESFYISFNVLEETELSSGKIKLHLDLDELNSRNVTYHQFYEVRISQILEGNGENKSKNTTSNYVISFTECPK